MGVIIRLKRFIKFSAALFLLTLVYGLIQPLRLTVTEVEIRDNDLPEQFSGKKIVFLTDSHLGHFLSQRRLGEMVSKVNDIGADIVILGGDYAEQDPRDYNRAFAELKGLRASLGVYAVLGNHDYKAGRKYIISIIEQSGIKSLDNEATWITAGENKIKIGGVGDLWLSNQDTAPTLSDTTPADFTVLVSHNPDYAKEVPTDKIDLVLAGHTHAGQVSLFGLWAPWVPSKYGQEFRYGLKDINDMKLYITSGLGTTFIPLRFFTRPEIAVITLKR